MLFRSVSQSRYEADDVIGALAKKAEVAGYEVYMVTPITAKTIGSTLSQS